MAAAIDTQFIVKQFGTGLRQVLGSTDTLTTEDAFNHLKVVHGKSDGKHAGVDGETRKVLMDQVWSLTQFYFFDFSKSRVSVKSVFSTNAQTRFASVVVDDVLEPLRLARHT